MVTSEELLEARAKGMSIAEIARYYGLNERSLRRRLSKLQGNQRQEQKQEQEFTHVPLPSTDIPVDELIELRKRQLEQLRIGKEARKLVPVKVNIPGPIGIVHLGDPHCLTPDHEILTKDGWKHHTELSKDDLIGGVDRFGAFCWQRIERYIERKANEEIIEIDTDSLSLCATLQHRVVAAKANSKGYGARTVYRAQELTNSQFKIPTGAWSSPAGACLSDDEIRLLAWLLTDSHWEFKEGTIKAFSLYQSKPAGVKLIEELLDRLGTPHTRYYREREGSHFVNEREGMYNHPEHTFRIGADEARRLFKMYGMQVQRGSIPEVAWSFSAAQFAVFLEVIVQADENRASANTVRVYKSHPFVDSLQALCAVHKYRTKKYTDSPTSAVLSITSASDACVKPRYDVHRRNYKGLIWCVTVEHGNFFTRRNGRVHLTGNCDDDGTDLALLERHTDLIRNTKGLFGANVGDTTNNWMGRLARLYAEQSTSAKQAWQIAEWFIKRVDWLYFLSGNHDAWSGPGDPIKWILRSGVPNDSGVRLNLQFPNGKEVRINARHTFPGHSMWNTAHGLSKAAQMGWRDHILIAGHTHVSGYQIVKDPMTGMLSHAIRVGSYKTYDRYAEQLGLPDQCISPAVVTVIDPNSTTETGLITVFHDVEEGAKFLTWKRQRS